jgi:hypothetical protein
MNDRLGDGVSSEVYSGFLQKASILVTYSDKPVAIKIITKPDKQTNMNLKIV